MFLGSTEICMYELFKLIRLNRDSKINQVDRIFF